MSKRRITRALSWSAELIAWGLVAFMFSVYSLQESGWLGHEKRDAWEARDVGHAAYIGLRLTETP